MLWKSPEARLDVGDFRVPGRGQRMRLGVQGRLGWREKGGLQVGLWAPHRGEKGGKTDCREEKARGRLP